mgnify:CR=1 FL=1
MEHTFRLVIHADQDQSNKILDAYYDGKIINNIEYDEENGKYAFIID